MKKLFPLALALSLALVVPALAGGYDHQDPGVHKDIDINVNVDKDINKTVNDKIDNYLDNHIVNHVSNNVTNTVSNNCKTNVCKDINVDVDVKAVKKDVDVNVDKNININVDKHYCETSYCEDICVGAKAEASACRTDFNSDNSVDARGVSNLDSVCDSFNQFSGISQLNQASGSMNNQGNVVTAAVAANCDAALAAQADVQLGNGYNQLSISGGTCLTDSIDHGFSDFTGLAQVNQSAGFMNNQSNTVALAADKNGGIVACADASLAMCNTNNSACVSCANTVNSVSNSFNCYSGLAQVSQSAGSMNNQANVVTIAAGVTH